MAAGSSWPTSLNPFEIRALFEDIVRRYVDDEKISLNPFEIRALFEGRSDRSCAQEARLNPFEIRALFED